MQRILDLIKRILPKSVLKKIRPLGHGFLAYVAAMRFGFPARKMVVIGITGTAGKSTTVQMLSRIFNGNGIKTGYNTTIDFFDGKEHFITPDGMSMPGRFRLQGNLRRMLDNGCAYAIVECTSEGLAQRRHMGIDFDVVALTLFAEAHIEAHGSVEKYRAAKSLLFKALGRSKRKKFFPEKMLGVNLDQDAAEFFLGFGADKKFGTTFEGRKMPAAVEPEAAPGSARHGAAVYEGTAFADTGDSISFSLRGVKLEIALTGKFNAYNALLASAIANMLGVPIESSARALVGEFTVPGRMERIPNERGITVFLDYGAEPISMKVALEALQHIPHRKIIHVFGSAGGHRDVRKRFEFGELTARMSDVAILCNEDVYDSDPNEIVGNIKQGIDRVPVEEQKVKDVMIILDREQAIRKAIEIAQPGDIIILTGKGIEQFMYLPGNKRVDWDDKKALLKYLNQDEHQSV